MIYLIVGLGLFFVAIAFAVKEKNAKYLLSGYNTMPPEKQRKVNLPAYIRLYRDFHIVLGTSFLVLGLVFAYFAGNHVTMMFVVIYPIAAYMYFIWRSNTFYKDASSSTNKVALWILGITLLLVVLLLALGP